MTSDFGADVFDDGDPIDDQPAATPARARRTRKRKSADDAESDPAGESDGSAGAGPAGQAEAAGEPADAAAAASGDADRDLPDGDVAAEPTRKSKARRKKATTRKKAARQAAEADDAADDVEGQRDATVMAPSAPQEDPADDDAVEPDPDAEPEARERTGDRPRRERRRRRRGGRGRAAEMDAFEASTEDDDFDAAPAEDRSEHHVRDDERADDDREADEDFGYGDAGDRELADDAAADRDDDSDRSDDDSDAEDRPRGGRHGDRDRDDDGEYGSRRGRRRRRRRHGGDGEFEDEGEAESAPHTRPSRDHARRVAFRAPAADAGRRGQRVAVFVDLDALTAADPATATEDPDVAGPALSYGRLLASLTGRRHLIRAFAYGDGSQAATLDGNGFEHREVSDRLGRVVALTVDALQIAQRVDTVVFVGADEALAPLYQALAAQGIRIETAGFEAGRSEQGAGPVAASHHHVLGEECTFRP